MSHQTASVMGVTSLAADCSDVFWQTCVTLAEPMLLVGILLLLDVSEGAKQNVRFL